MEQKTVLITGGTSGIGKATALRFAAGGHIVFLTARHLTDGNKVVAKIITRTGNPHVRCLPADLSTIRGCQQLVATVIREIPGLQLLINNAGVFMTEKILTADGFETNFMVNYLAPFILSTGLADLLARNAPARILSVNTGLHLRGYFDLEKTPYGLDFGPRASYRNTKLANALFTVELAHRLADKRVMVNAFSPGLYNTGVLKVKGLERLFYKIAGAFYGLYRPISQSAAAPYYLATDDQLTTTTGAFFYRKKLAAFAPQAADADLREKLWDETLGWISGGPRGG